MAQQKLYTEEQVKEIVLKSRETGLTADYLMLNATTIELPSDEEIDKAIFPYMDSLAKAGFIDGAKWMRDKILNK